MTTTKRNQYFVNGKKVPGVTSIISSRRDPGGLIHWAWQCGMDGQDYRDVRDRAADAGHLAHEMIDAWLHKREFESAAPAEIADKAKQGYESFLEWVEANQFEVFATELELASESNMYGGRLDCVARCRGRLVLADWKTSNALYPDYLVQCAAYQMLWDENVHAEKITSDEKIERIELLRFGKDHADFHHHSYPVEMLEPAREQFLLLRRAYDLDKALKGMLK